MVPIHELDSMVGELAEDFDFGLGAYRIANPERELGQFRLNIKAPNIKLPKVAVSIAKGAYSVLAPASKPTKKAPVRAAVRKVQKAKKAPVVIARKKPEQNNISSPQTLAQIFGELKRQGKIVNLLATKKQVTASHTRRSCDDDFRDTVTTLLRKIEKQCAGDISGNYFARWNKLKKATGVGI
jgi:hypothetical protein